MNTFFGATTSPDKFDSVIDKNNMYEDIELLKERLWKKTEPSEPILEEQFKYTDSKNKIIYIINPVLMAVVLDEYKLAEALVDKGYEVDDRRLPEQYLLECGDGVFTYCMENKLLMTQIIFTKKEIPISLLEKIIKVLDNKKTIFSYSRDVKKKQFGYRLEEEEWVVALAVMEKIYNINPDYLNGFIEDKYIYLEYRAEFSEYIYVKLMELLKAPKDLLMLIDKVLNQYLCENLELKLRRKELFVNLKNICEKNPKIASGVFVMISEIYVKKKIYNFYDAKIPYEREYKKILRFLYDKLNMADAIKYLANNASTPVVDIEIINMWKKCLSWKFVVDRFDTKYLKFFEKILADYDDVYNTNRVFQCIDEIAYKKYKINLKCERNILERILEYRSEELLIICIRKGFYFGELLDLAINIALEGGYTEVVPILLYAKNKEAIKCIQ